MVEVLLPPIQCVHLGATRVLEKDEPKDKTDPDEQKECQRDSQTLQGFFNRRVADRGVWGSIGSRCLLNIWKKSIE